MNVATEETATAEDQALALEPEPESTVLHLAMCRTCDAGVNYNATVSGAGIVVHERYGMDIDQSIGIGEGGLPLCPRGHGEMQLHDEQLPAGEAIERVCEQLAGGEMEPLQGTLPGIVPPFNYQGAYMELEGMAVEVDRLEREYDDAAAVAKDAKKAWDKAEEVYTKMALEFRRRRREKVAAGEPVNDLDQSRCTFEQLNPDADCPLCDNSIVDIEGMSIAPKTSAEHAEQAAAMILTREVADLIELLAGEDMVVSEATVRDWSVEDRNAVRDFAHALIEDTYPRPERPTVLGTMHVAGEPNDAGGQECTQCDATLRTPDDETDNYIPGWLIGTDCPGKPKEEQRYIKRRKSTKGKK